MIHCAFRFPPPPPPPPSSFFLFLPQLLSGGGVFFCFYYKKKKKLRGDEGIEKKDIGGKNEKEERKKGENCTKNELKGLKIF